MLVEYHGEFLTSPVPLEMSLNFCSHKCNYCFSNLSEPDRKADVKRIMRLLRDYPERNTVVAMLLKAGYPVVVSNRVDPFAASNYKVMLPILELMRDMEIDVAIQTKGGLGIDAGLDILKPSVWYISIAFADDALRARIEPGAPSLDERYRLMETLVTRGHRVVVGLNPLVPEWLPDPLPTLQRIKASGATGVWIERLHLNPKQAKNLSEKERAALTEPIIKRAHKRTPGDDFEHFLRTRDQAQDAGLEVFSKNQPNASQFFAPWRDVYAHTFPTLQDWINHLAATKHQGDLVTFDEFLAYFGPQFPAGIWPIDSYLGSVAHNIWHTHAVPPQMTYSQLLALIWQEPRVKVNPANSPAFAFAARNGEPVTDDRGFPVLAFVPDGWFEWWYEVD